MASASVLYRFRQTATSGAYNRYPVISDGISQSNLSHSFFRAFDAWSNSHVTQSQNRSEDRIASVEEFILMRRSTIGVGLVEGMCISHICWQPVD